MKLEAIMRKPFHLISAVQKVFDGITIKVGQIVPKQVFFFKKQITHICASYTLLAEHYE